MGKDWFTNFIGRAEITTELNLKQDIYTVLKTPQPLGPKNIQKIQPELLKTHSQNQHKAPKSQPINKEEETTEKSQGHNKPLNIIQPNKPMWDGSSQGSNLKFVTKNLCWFVDIWVCVG